MPSPGFLPRVADVPVAMSAPLPLTAPAETDVPYSATDPTLRTVASPGSLTITRLLGRVPPAHRALTEQIVRYGTVGGVCTALFSVLYLALAAPLGTTLATTVAMVVAAVLNTGLNRRHTFRISGGGGAARHHAQGLVILALNWALAAGSIAALRLLVPAAPHVTELLVLTGANLGGTLLRFTLLRTWVFARPQHRPLDATAS